MNPEKSLSTGRLSMLVWLVILVFITLLISIGGSGFLLYLFIKTGVFLPLTANRLPVVLFFLLLTSLFVGTIIAIFAGERYLRPLRDLTEATKEIAAGNFNVHVEVGNQPEIDRLAVSFNEMAKELSSIETLRSDFVSNISHEFKTPVASIRGFARRLQKSTLTDEQRLEYLDIIISQSERLARFSGNVLFLSTLENADKAFEQADYSLDEQIRKSILLMEPQLQSKHLEVDVNLESARIYASEEMLSHLWINLLGNAIKFSLESGVITVALQKSEEKAIVTISDRGIGMSDEVQKRIFDKFYQGDPSRATEGNGLGLSLVKRILELQGGRIEVDSEPGKGSRFTVFLSLHR